LKLGRTRTQRTTAATRCGYSDSTKSGCLSQCKSLCSCKAAVQCLQLPRGDEIRPLYCPRHLTNSESLLVAFPIRQSRLFFVLFCSACLRFPRGFYSDIYDLVTPPRLQALASFNDPLRKSVPLRCDRLFGRGKDSFAFSCPPPSRTLRIVAPLQSAQRQ
jgi:hypothetical protein